MVIKRDLLELLRDRPGPCISMYMPTHRAAPETEQDPIRFKNLLRLIESELVSSGMRSPDAGSLLEKAHKLRYDALFWRGQSDGLACFMAPDFFHIERVPLRLDPEYKVSGRFFIKPLLPLIDAQGRFFILALSQNQAQLYEATSHSLAQVPLDSVPESVASLLPDRRVDARLQYHSAGPTGQRQNSAAPIYHGHADSADKDEADIVRYLREVDRAVYQALKEAEGPLVLACVGFLASLYESVNSYRNLMRSKIPGNPTSWSEQELHAKARELARPRLDKPFRLSLRQYKDSFATPLTSSSVEEILLAAHAGRVETLFVTAASECLGSFHAAQRLVEIGPAKGDEDLIDLAAAMTIEKGGAVFAIEEASQQSESLKCEPLAAIFRYAVPTESRNTSSTSSRADAR